MGFDGFQNPPVGAQGALTRDRIKSPDFQTGVTGWSVDKDGSAEFQSAILRGQITVTDPNTGHSVVIQTGSILLFTGSVHEAVNGSGLIFPTVLNAGLANEQLATVVQSPVVSDIGVGSPAQYIATSQSRDGTVGALHRFSDSFSTDTFVVDATKGVFSAKNMISGTVNIVPSAANTPTSKVVTFPVPLSGTSFICMVTANSTVPGTGITGVSYTGLSSTGVTIWVTRTNTTSCNLDYLVLGR